jgi:exodeoxyribonuclease VII small subunit
LRDQNEPNIDDLLTIVTESVDAYKVCKERIDAVEAALRAALDGVGVGAPASVNTAATERTADAPAMRPPPSSRAGRATPPPSGGESSDDDIPF